MSGAGRSGARRARRVIARAPKFLGWNTTDQEEVERRRWRGRSELMELEPRDPDQGFFGTFRVRSASGSGYDVEIRSLASPDNSCGCIDHRVNGLGTCKHIEGVLFALRRGKARDFDRAARQGGSHAEVYLSRHGEARARVLWPAAEQAAPLRGVLAAFFSDEGDLIGDPLVALPALRAAIADLPDELGDRVRISRHLEDWLEHERHRLARRDERERFLAEAADGRAELELLHHPLLPYQREGMLHLAFGERALLADEMGLGKTVQAIAACDLLRRERGISRVLVVGPASLKAEWREQIARFTDLTVGIVEGGRAKRLQAYREPPFFTLGNYEQIVRDGSDINRILKPDVVILDEAQRIKNWQTKTAHAVKGLRSPYAFVLTGTPLENRIDEIYSIVQYLDPELLGPLFRFNRDFYELDERGRPVDYQNLEELHRRLEPVMLRRRKSDVEDELPSRTTTNYFVEMTEEQRLRYQDYEAMVARLVAIARRRSLTKEEFDRLQKRLACMRMICDTPYILDPDCRDCPKLEELEGILADCLAEPECKIIIFSEWVRMLELVGELAREMEVDAAWHTGRVPQPRRRAELTRFKSDPACRLLLSSESGSVGLNLQAANVVINLDLPWNPAKLEQRIARAWRKHQRRPVSVINLVTQDSIEHRMLYLLSQKQDLAEGVLDGRGDLEAIHMPSGRQAFIERLEAALADAAVDAEPVAHEDFAERLHAEFTERHGEDLLLLETRRHADGRESVLAVIDGAPGAVPEEIERLAAAPDQPDGVTDAAAPRVEVLDRAGFAALQRLLEAGIVSFAGEARQLHRSPILDDGAARRRQRLIRARTLYDDAERKLRMAALLAGGGFAEEARAPLQDAVEGAVTSLSVLSNGEGADEPAASLPERMEDLVAKGLLNGEATAAVAAIEASRADDGPATVRIPALIHSAEGLLDRVGSSLESAAVA